jgi:hypothetical protein
MIRRDNKTMAFPMPVPAKIQELTEDQKQERRKAYDMFRKVALAKAQLVSEAIGDLKDLGFDMTDMQVETAPSGDEFLKCEGEAVYKAELTRENVADADPPQLIVTGVKGYWLKTVLEPKKIIQVSA